MLFPNFLAYQSKHGLHKPEAALRRSRRIIMHWFYTDMVIKVEEHTFLSSITFCIALYMATTIPEFVTGEPRQLVFKLIHRDSIHSPLRNRDKNLRTSIPGQRNDLLPCDEVIQVDNIHHKFSPFTFLMNFSIGQPPVPQLTIMDTGSSLLWIHCFPCETCQSPSMLNPLKSSSYTSFDCFSTHCFSAPRRGCNSAGECTYRISYISDFAAEGILGIENLTFDTLDEGSIVVPNVVFGCSHRVGNWSNGREITGIFGLGPRLPSIVPMMNYKFSYCIGNLRDPNYDHNKLILGDGAIIEGDSTPLYFINNHYGVVLEGISVGLETLDIDQSVFRMETDGDGVVIDSGTQVTYLALDGFRALRDKVKSLLDEFLIQTRIEDDEVLCYNGYMYQDLEGFPVVSFHFAEGADLVLEAESLFYHRAYGEFCLAIFPSVRHESYKHLSIIGLLAQQYYNVAYDVAGKRLYLERIDCELLQE